jgi:peptidoglycan/xylan/chitin deacetylase (PgdA/CDA1 family)
VSGQSRRPIAVVLRYDDYSAKSDAAADCTMIDCLKRFHLPATFGVTPYVCSSDVLDPSDTTLLPLAGEKLSLLREAVDSVGIEVALHGYSHQANRLARRSEFVGLGFDEQSRRITKGRDFLETAFGIRPTTFVPPFNSYDSVTLSVLESLGFQTISSGLYGEMYAPSRLKFLPATCTLSDLRGAVASARRSGDPRPVVVAMIHPYDLDVRAGDATTTAQGGLEGMLKWLSSQPDVEVKSIGQLVASGENLPQSRFRSCRQTELGLPSTLPLLRVKRSLFYPSEQTLSKIRRRQDIVTGLLLVTLVLAAAALGIALRVLLGGHARSIVVGIGLAGCAASIAIVLRGIATRYWSYIRLIEIAVLLGIAIAAWRG